jgi:ribosome biogenesis GTPase
MAVHRGEIAVMGAGLEGQISSRLATSQGEEDRPTVGDWLLIDSDSHEAMRILTAPACSSGARRGTTAGCS